MARRSPEDIKRDKLADIYEKQANEDAKRKDMSKTQAEREAAERRYQALLTQELNILEQIAKLREREEKSLDSITRKLQDQIKALEDKEDRTETENDLLSKTQALQTKITSSIAAGTANTGQLVGEFETLNAEMKKTVKEATALQEASEGFLNDITGAISKIPILGGALSSAFKSFLKTDKGKELSKTIAKKMFDKKAVSKALGSSIGFALGSSLIVAGFTLMVKNSEVMKDIRRNLGLTNDEAKEFRSMSKDMLGDSNSMATTQKEILEAASQLSDVYGTTVQNNRKLVDNQITLTKGFGLQAEDAEKISMLADATGQSYDNQLHSTIATAQATGKVYKFNFNTNKILADVAKLSASIQASFKGSAASMAKAVIQTKLMGTTLQQMDGVADNLLQIESSIENQVTAQLVTGKNINLDKARMLSLNNDLVGVGNELVKQGIDYATFGKMNRVEQQATAAAMGMQKDEFADMLMKQEVYKRAGADIAATDSASMKLNEEKIALLAAQGDEEATKYIQAQKQLSVQERMTAAMERFSAVMEGIFNIILGIGVALSVAALIGSAGLAGPMVAAAWGAGAGLTTAIAAQYVQDGIAPASNGPFTVTDRKGNIGITSAGDGLVATPNRPGANNSTNNSTPIVNVSLVVGNTAIREIGNKVAMSNSYNAGVGNSYNRLG